MVSTSFFDATYYALVTCMIALLVSTIIVARFSRVKDRKIAVGTAYFSLGALITLVGSAILLALGRSSALNGFLYQQLQFSTAYAGFAIFLFGLDSGLLSNQFTGINLKRVRIFVWCSYFLTIAVSSLYLFNPATYKVTIIGSQEHVAQQTVFWYPLFLALVISALTAFYISSRKNSVSFRRYAIWFGLCCSLILLGTLRESTVIPSAGDPFADLLFAFLPFIAGSFCILMAARSLHQSSENPKVLDVTTTTKN
jgi:hypothetical protein